MSALKKSFVYGTFYTFGYLNDKGKGVPFRGGVTIIDRRNAQSAVLDAQKNHPEKKVVLLVSHSNQKPYPWQVWNDDQQTKIDSIARNFENHSLNNLYGAKELHEADHDSLTNFLNAAKQDNVELYNRIAGNYAIRIQDCQDYVDAIQVIIDEQEEFIQDIAEYGFED